MSVTLHTDLGDLKIEIFCESVPKTAENFLALCAKGTYNDTKILRNIKGFMVQMGDPTGTGKGGESIWGHPFKDEIRTALRHSSRGIVSMSNSGPDTNQSQFFITYQKHTHLDGKYTVFGKVIGGLETLDKLENDVEVDKKNRPKTPIYIRSVTIHANPLAD
ncbi:similar to Saccharomyces cerevisiae YDR155C CPR1 Cytoplasmic peptidyl-prolyl cis-trans isomerase (cyclophilin) [Geotrichum candidum]|uniref:Peptidyl-prolyl cis-trans isomerase n=1 Tax=Geotrichum candidum TaxID=1173061 RepID=A0A0J9X2G0_GEOCN|nr:similar to Saccharomyces cerevisiae YDR155C CPR1 Cytoplasmic peptidyl-prolyl cis-trans isomerase (cyclophilin) [Geotrichum candidum]